MRKSVDSIFFMTIILSFVVFSLSFASAGFFDWLTGKATEQNVGINITVGSGAAPSIVVFNETMTDVSGGLSEGTSTEVTINLSVTDPQGVGNIDTSSVQVNFSKSGETNRTNSSCVTISGESNSTSQNFTCLITLWWFDGAGTWSISASASDINNNVGTSFSQVFSVGTTTGFVSSPSSLSWTQITPGAANQTANNDPLLLNNTGNVDISSGNVEVNATNLVGESTPSEALYANNFSVGPTTGGDAECAATTMSANAFTGVTSASLSAGNYTVNDGSTGQEQLYVCLKEAGSELSAQSYSTAGSGSWTVRIV